MSVVEMQELDEVKGLLAKGQQVGVLTYAEITTAMSELDLDESDVEELHGFLERSSSSRRSTRRRRRPRRSSARRTNAVAGKRKRRWT
jgi:RNA polymerase primary sigma factor